MLKLRDFFHLPLVDTFLQELIDSGPGLCLVAGLDLRQDAHSAAPAAPVSPERFLPSGRSAVFWILMEEIIAAHPAERCLIVADDRRAVRVPRGLKGRVDVLVVQAPYTYQSQILAAASRRPGLLVVDRLTAETIESMLTAAQKGLRVLSQIDTVFRGAGVARQLLDLGVSSERLAGLGWILSVQRFPSLCPRCKQPVEPVREQIARLRQQHPQLAYLLTDQTAFYQASGCRDCQGTGRRGDVVAFDIYLAGRPPADPLEQPSRLPMEAYLFHLGTQGRVSFSDFVDFDGDQFRRTYRLLAEREQALLEANAALQARLLQLEAAHRVLQRRTDALISVQDIGQALITSGDLADLARRVCRRTCELCGADRAILYFQSSGEQVDVLASAGWDSDHMQTRLPVSQAFSRQAFRDPVPFSGLPPGVVARSVESEPLRAGLYVPLIAQDGRVGLMIVQSTQKTRFEPGEVALLQTFASQAALALQRAGLVEQLRGKIGQLEAAQAGLAQKERLEREMELARQVQQSVLPLDFPTVAGFRFAAQNEPARRVGGDFYDIFSLDDDHFGLAVADVSDKGMPAALYMALTRSLLRAEARRERSPSAVVVNVNRLLFELGDAKNFVTLFYAVVDSRRRRLRFTRAGHDRPVLLRGGKASELDGTGPALGLLAGEDFQVSEEQVQLLPGDRLALYTDGLCDGLNPDEVRFGRERLIALLSSHAGRPAQELCAAVFAELETYRGQHEQFDDMTLVIVELDS